MAKFNNSDIPEDKFAEVTIGNNGVRIVQNVEVEKKGNISRVMPVSIYLSAEDIMEIFAKFIAGANHSDEIETVYLNAEVEDIDEKDEDKIMDANY